MPCMHADKRREDTDHSAFACNPAARGSQLCWLEEEEGESCWYNMPSILSSDDVVALLREVFLELFVGGEGGMVV
jgi:hypothetical protein